MPTQLVENTGSGKALSVIMARSVPELYAIAQPAIARVEATAEGLLDTANVEQLGDANALLGQMVGQLEALAPLQLPWVLKPLQGLVYYMVGVFENTKIGVQNKLKSRKSQRTALVELNADYEQTAAQIAANLEQVERMIADAVEAKRALNQIVEALQADQAALEAAIASWNQEDVQGLANARAALQRHEKMIADAVGIGFSQETTIARLSSQRAQRETLYGSLTAFSTQLRLLLTQQLQESILQLEVRAGAEKLKQGRDGLRAAMRHNAARARGDATLVAEVATEPLLDSKTIDAVADDLIGMITDVREKVVTGIANSRQAVETAQAASMRIHQAVLSAQTETRTGEMR